MPKDRNAMEAEEKLNYKNTMNVKHKMICYTSNNWSLRHGQ
jgi:hypothetical protein